MASMRAAAALFAISTLASPALAFPKMNHMYPSNAYGADGVASALTTEASPEIETGGDYGFASSTSIYSQTYATQISDTSPTSTDSYTDDFDALSTSIGTYTDLIPASSSYPSLTESFSESIPTETPIDLSSSSPYSQTGVSTYDSVSPTSASNYLPVSTDGFEFTTPTATYSTIYPTETSTCNDVTELDPRCTVLFPFVGQNDLAAVCELFLQGPAGCDCGTVSSTYGGYYPTTTAPFPYGNTTATGGVTGTGIIYASPTTTFELGGVTTTFSTAYGSVTPIPSGSSSVTFDDIFSTDSYSAYSTDLPIPSDTETYSASLVASSSYTSGSYPTSTAASGTTSAPGYLDSEVNSAYGNLQPTATPDTEEYTYSGTHMKQPPSDNDDRASEDSPETDYSEAEDGDVTTEELYKEYIKGDTLSESSGEVEELFLAYIQGEENRDVVKENVEGQMVKKGEERNAEYMYQRVNDQGLSKLQDSGPFIKREEEGWSSPGVKRRISLGIEDLPDYKTPRLRTKQENVKIEQKVNDFDPRTTNIDDFVHDIPEHREIVLGPIKDEVESKYRHLDIQHPWLHRFHFTKRHNNESLLRAISFEFAKVTSQSYSPLSQEQKDLIRVILRGDNVFFTGSACSGKSTVLGNVVEILRVLGVHVYIIAPTGRAALAAKGMTFYSYAGWTPNHMRRPIEKLEEACGSKRIWTKLNHTEVLIIDEVSMFENHKLERLNAIMKKARRYSKHIAFGGVQLIVTGDFCQLPPVLPFRYCYLCGEELSKSRNGLLYHCTTHGHFKHGDRWAFRSGAWEECDFVHSHLREIHRQSDPNFIRILETKRLGKPLSTQDKQLLLHHKSETEGAVKLFPKREQVAAVNDSEFAKLVSPIETYICRDHFQNNVEHCELEEKNERNPEDDTLVVLEDHRYEAQLKIRVGMLVLLLINLDLQVGLVNGSQRIVIGFAEPPKRKDARPNPDTEYGMYKSARVEEFIARKSIKKYPVVRFFNNQERIIYPDCQVEELGDCEPFSLLSRTQIPLMAAWAMTIHKCQGMTLSRVIVNLADAWQRGQEYVALSRARSLNGLKVEALGNKERGGDPQVMQFLWDKFRIGEMTRTSESVK